MDAKESLKAFFGKRFELTRFERGASKAELTKIEEAMLKFEESRRRFFEEVRVQVLTRAGVPAELLPEVKVSMGVDASQFPIYVEVQGEPEPEGEAPALKILEKAEDAPAPPAPTS